MKKSIILSALMFSALGAGAANVEVYGDFTPGENGLPKKWFQIVKTSGSVDVIAVDGKNIVQLSSENKDKKGIGIFSVPIPAVSGNRFKVTATINGGPCQIELFQYGAGMQVQKVNIPARKKASEISHEFTVKDSPKGPVKSVRFAFRVIKGAGCSVSDVKVESLTNTK